ncbi:MAG: hypothetical protein V4584_14375 [Verrucomicrobiota bacterium]
MSTSYRPSKIFILVAAACLVWIGLLSLAFMAISGMALSAGWIFAGALVFALAVWTVVMLKEIRQAILLPDFSAFGRRGNDGFEMAGTSTVSRPRSGIMDRTFTGRRWTAPRSRYKVRPRKVRSRWMETAGQRQAAEIFHPDV